MRLKEEMKQEQDVPCFDKLLRLTHGKPLPAKILVLDPLSCRSLVLLVPNYISSMIRFWIVTFIYFLCGLMSLLNRILIWAIWA